MYVLLGFARVDNFEMTNTAAGWTLTWERHKNVEG